MIFPDTKIVTSEAETSALAEEFANILTAGAIVCLNGNLGSGKTYFVKSICSYFGIDSASSPSFGIVNEYSSKPKIIHFDFYRIKKVEELYDIGFDDYLSQKDSIVFIEWANMFQEILPKKYYQLNFSIVDEFTREIIFKKNE